MQNDLMETYPCNTAYDYLDKNVVEPDNENLPSGAASWYIPMRRIKVLFEEEPDGLTLEAIFLCPCNRCKRDGGSVDDRSASFNTLRENELRHDYAAIFALLIYIARPGLIRVFQKYELKLYATRYLRDEDFHVLRNEPIASFDALKSRVLRDQYSFLVRTLKPYSDVTAIPSKELLPIKENPQPKGEGSFAVVHCFEFQDEEYRSNDFGHIGRFARKIFKKGMDNSAAKEWYNLQCLSKADNHKHLMPALGAYWHGNKFFILQEEAELSLHDYLKGEGDKYRSDELWKQVQGVADGLDKLHKLYKKTKIAYHQDLKPANILIVRGILKIADFGLLEFKPIPLGDSGSTGIDNAHNTGYYAAPRHGRYTREDDIWSLACIMSELATSDIQGRDEVDKYRKARIASCPSGKDTPKFFWQQNVKAHVLDRHRQLQRMVQSWKSTGPEGGMSEFQMKFYSTDFFPLLNNMFRHTHTNNSLEVSSHVAVPDAGYVAEKIAKLQKEAIPTPSLDTGMEGPTSSPKMSFRDAENLISFLERYREDFKHCLDEKDVRKFRIVTLGDFKQFIVNLQARQIVERRQQALKRLDPFIEAFEQLGGLLDEFCESNDFMAFIWGPFKFILETASIHADAFNAILDIYRQIGQNQPLHSQYVELFRTQPDMTLILSAVYGDIIHVHKLTLRFFRQPLWKDLFATTWMSYRSHLLRYISHMVSRLNLVTGHVAIVDFHKSQDSFATDNEQARTEMEIEDLKRRQAIYTWLKPMDMDSEQYHFENIRAQYPSTGSWLLEHKTFKEWLDPQAETPSALLWLHGNPGVGECILLETNIAQLTVTLGKTILASIVVKEAKELPPSSTTLFFYFKQGDDERDNFKTMARSLLAQLLKQDSGILDYIYNRCCNSGEAFLTSHVLIEKLLRFALGNCNSAYVVLDGLDECCSREERKTVVKFFRDMIENVAPNNSDHDRIRCLFVSRKDSARKDFSGLAHIPVALENNENDIDNFNYVHSQKLGVKFDISAERMEEIANFVSAFAEGVFLVAELVWKNLYGQTSIEGLEQEMQSLPTTDLDKLDEVYARIIRTITNKPVRAEREEALNLLRWLICAKRPLKLHEVQTMKSINLDQQAVEFERRRFRVDPKDLCESLVDVREDGTVELVHLTAKVYLVKSEVLDIAAEEIRLATLCIDYLNLPVFSSWLCKQDVLDGNYGFMEYAILNWVRHLEAALSSSSGQDTLFEELHESLEVLLERHWNNPTIEQNTPKRTLDILDIFKSSQKFKQIQQAVVSMKEQINRFGDISPGERALDFTKLIDRIRVRLESVVSDNPDGPVADDMKLKYGINLFKCPRFSCKYFSQGFASKSERDRHVERHERPARCTDTNCTGFIIGFPTETQLARHLRETHPTLVDRDQSFPTEEEVAQSLVELAPETTPMPERQEAPEPEKETELEFQAHNMEQPARNQRTRKRAKVPQELQCHYCHKKFGKKYNLQSHLKTHGVGQTFTCTICDADFARKSDLTRHSTVHSSEKDFKCGGFLQNGQPWGCGQSFTRADILRSHHKTKKGKKCIGLLEQDE